jgi:uncharacterized RDD family membrane protein YckC
MENKEGKGSAEPRAGYVWDPDKLAWVETVEEPIVEEVPAEITREESSAEIAEGADLVEAVEEAGGLVYRGAWIRLAAFAIDFIVLITIAAILTAIVGTESTVAEYMRLAAGFIYFVGFWSWRGQTPGKMVIRAKIVKSDGSTIGFGNAILRYLFYLAPTFAPILFFADRVVDYLPTFGAIVGFLIIALSSRKLGLHDMIAGTCVIDSRAIVLEPYTDELA